MLDPEKLLVRDFPTITHSYGVRDTILYALGLGLGHDPSNPAHLRAIFEEADGFGALPSMANVLAYPGFWLRQPDTGVDWTRVLHGEQSFKIHRPLAAEATLTGKTQVTGIVDKGADKGALVLSKRALVDDATGETVAEVASTAFCRGDGGCGSVGATPDVMQRVPDRAPDAVYDHTTPPGIAAIYRLSGDYNPLHVDPGLAQKVGFDRPILHGLATLGIAAWSLTQAVAGGRSEALSSLKLRFSRPTYPGETIRTEVWQEADGFAFRARVPARDVTVLDTGFATLFEETK